MKYCLRIFLHPVCGRGFFGVRALLLGYACAFAYPYLRLGGKSIISLFPVFFQIPSFILQVKIRN